MRWRQAYERWHANGMWLAWRMEALLLAGKHTEQASMWGCVARSATPEAAVDRCTWLAWGGRSLHAPHAGRAHMLWR